MIPTSNNSFNFTDKQKKFLSSRDSRLNFLCGSVRSGKTFISLIKFFFVVASAPKEYEFIICGKTLMSLKRNCLTLLQSFVGKNNFKFSLTSKQGTLFGHTVYLEGANDESSEQKIRGMTLAGAYCDEITLYPQSFVQMLLSRLSMPNSKFYATCNPDTPSHYIKTEYIDNPDLDKSVWNFLLTDNTFLPKEYLDNITKEYSGVFYNRFILGQWVRAEGIIYQDFANNPQDFYILPTDLKDIIKINVGVDFGGTGSATTFVATGFTKGLKCVIPLISERHQEALNPEQLNEKFADFIDTCYSMYGMPMSVYCDSAEQILIRGLKRIALQRHLLVDIRNARKNPILERIKLTQQLIAQGRFKVCTNAKTVSNALCEAVWDEKHEDQRLDDGSTDIDTLDAFEYSIEPEMINLTKFYKGA